MMGYEVTRQRGMIEVRATGEGYEHAFIRVDLVKDQGACSHEGGINRKEGIDPDCTQHATHLVTICDAPELSLDELGPDEYFACWRHASHALGYFLTPTEDELP